MTLFSQRRLEGKRAWAAIALVVVIAAVLVWRLGAGGHELPAPSPQGEVSPGLQTWQQGGAASPARPGVRPHAADPGPWGAGSGQAWQDTVVIDVTQPFRARDGQLVVDASTLRTLEQVLAFRGTSSLGQKARSVAADLPPDLQAQAADLAERHGRYDQARRMAVSPDQAPTSVAHLQAQFEALQALQREHFGPQVARQLFGADDAVTARLLQHMAEDPDISASLEDKAARAQALYTAELDQAGP